eukprot:COSAG04_NODE_226_length_19492_cov_9.475790_3_plen_1006_part_00
MSLEIFDGAEEIAQQAALRSPAKSGVTVPRIKNVRAATRPRAPAHPHSRLSAGGAQSPARVGLSNASPNAMRASPAGIGATKKKLGMQTAKPMKTTAPPPKPSAAPEKTKEAEVSAPEPSALDGYLAPAEPSPPPTESISIPSLPDASELPTHLGERISFGPMIRGIHAKLDANPSADDATQAHAQELQQLTDQHRQQTAELVVFWQEKCQGLQDEIKELKSQQSEQEGLSALVSRNEVIMKQQADSWMKQLEATKEELESTKSALQSQGEECDALQKRCEELEQKTIKLHSNHFNEKIVNQGLNKAMQVKLEELQATADAEKQSWAEERESLEQKAAESLQKLEKTVSEMEAQHKDELAQLRSSQEAEMQAATSGLQQELASAKASATGAVTMTPMLSASELGLMDEFETVESVLERGSDMERQNTELTEAVQQKDAEVVELLASSQALTEQLDSAISTLETAKSERNEAIEIGAGAIANGIDLQSQLEHSSATIEGCRQELTDTVSRMEQNLDETVGTLEAKRQTEMEEATARHAATTTELEATTDKVQALEKQLSASTTKADDLQESLSKTNASLDKATKYTQEQRGRIDELLSEATGLQQRVDETEAEKESALRRVAELQNDVQVKVTEVQAGVGKALSLQKEVQRLNDMAAQNKEAVRDGGAALERCEELEGKLELLNTELMRAQTQLKRASTKASEAEKKFKETSRSLKSTQRALEASEERASVGETKARSERAAREAAEANATEASSQRAQAEFDRTLVEGEKSQMMMKLDMLVRPIPLRCSLLSALKLSISSLCPSLSSLCPSRLPILALNLTWWRWPQLMTRGEPMEVVQLVRTQTELEVEVRKLKETLERAEAQTVEAREQAQAARDQAASTRCVQLSAPGDGLGRAGSDGSRDCLQSGDGVSGAEHRGGGGVKRWRSLVAPQTARSVTRKEGGMEAESNAKSFNDAGVLVHRPLSTFTMICQSATSSSPSPRSYRNPVPRICSLKCDSNSADSA